MWSEIMEITTLDMPELMVFKNSSESSLMHWNEPDPGLFIAESELVVTRALDAGYEPVSVLYENRKLSESEDKLLKRLGDIPKYCAKESVLSEIIGYKLTRGFLCAMRRRTLPSACDICKNARKIAILEDVMNPTNVGAIFRSAAALGIDAVILTKGCADPLYRRAVRVSMGNVFLIDWTFWDECTGWPEKGLKSLSEWGFTTIALALSDDSVPIDDERLMRSERTAIILGSEGYGLCADTIKGCDYTARIPMKEGVDSLNVAAASAVAFWQLAGRKREY